MSDISKQRIDTFLSDAKSKISIDDGLSRELCNDFLRLRGQKRHNIIQEESEQTKSLELAFFSLAFMVHSKSGVVGAFNTDRVGIKKLLERDDFTFTRYMFIRELLQNAVDTEEEGSISKWVIILEENGGLTFSHTGRPFSPPKDHTPCESESLFSVNATTKNVDFSTIGQFGLGFKAWMLFFNGVTVECSNEQIHCRIEWDTGEGNYILKEFSISESERSENITTFRFKSSSQDSKAWDEETLQNIVKEVSQIVNIRDSPVEVTVSSPNKEVKISSQIIKEKEILSESTPKIWSFRCKTTIEDKDDDAMSSEIVNHVIQAEIMRNSLLDASIEDQINSLKAEYQNEKDHKAHSLKRDDWYRSGPLSSKVSFCLSLHEDFEPRSWLSSLVPVDFGINAWDNLSGECRWLIDAPFFLNHDRKRLNESGVATLGNIEIIRQALRNCFPRMYELIGHEEENKQKYIEWLLELPEKSYKKWYGTLSGRPRYVYPRAEVSSKQFSDRIERSHGDYLISRVLHNQSEDD